jgi:hypothetical protein
MPAVETLAFALREGLSQNLFFRRGPVAAHVVATSGAAPRVLFAFPAGNTGAGLWFEPRAEPVAVEVEGPLAVVEKGSMRGVSATLSIAAPELRVRGAVLGSVRALRAYAHRGEAPVGLVQDVDEGPPFTLARTTLDGRHRVVLHLSPQGGASVRADSTGRITLAAAPGEPLRLTITALTDEPPLTPIPSDDLLAPGAVTDPHAHAVLAFLAYEEKLLAGSWRFLTYFGRDTLLSLHLLLPVLRPRVVESGLGAVLDRLGPEGDVAHEEAIGEWAALERPTEGRRPEDPCESVLDRSMVDDDFLLAPLAAAALLVGPCRERAREFLSRRTPGGDTYAEALSRNLSLVLRLAAPFAEAPVARSLIALREGHAAGNWRDSDEGLGGGRIPFDVNAAMVPAALSAAARLYASGLLGDPPPGADRVRALAVAYRRAFDLFRVQVPADEAHRRVAAYADAMGIDPAPALASIQGDIAFPALSLDTEGTPIPVMHSDDGFVLLFTDPPPSYVEEAAARIVRPFPAGLRTPAGLVVANPVFCKERALRDLFTPAHYHGTVIWSWQHALYAAGVRRQLRRADLPLRTRAALALAKGVLGEVLRTSKAWRTSELWSVWARAGKLERVPFGALGAHHDESNAAQLWSTVVLALSG